MPTVEWFYSCLSSCLSSTDLWLAELLINCYLIVFAICPPPVLIAKFWKQLNIHWYTLQCIIYIVYDVYYNIVLLLNYQSIHITVYFFKKWTFLYIQHVCLQMDFFVWISCLKHINWKVSNEISGGKKKINERNHKT